jgi:hypothetical protein
MARKSATRETQQPYPTRGGIAISPFELGMTPPHEYASEGDRLDNHHGEFSRRMFGANIILQTLRDLDILQWELYMSDHLQLHKRYAPTPLPTLEQAMQVIDDQYQNGGFLKLGSIGDPLYREISDELMADLKKVYDEVRRV